MLLRLVLTRERVYETSVTASIWYEGVLTLCCEDESGWIYQPWYDTILIKG
jgi:hypothetical protein